MTIYTLNQRPYTTNHPLEEELIFPANTNILCQLPNWGVLDVVGEAAQSFLQGQLTCDVHQVTADHMLPGALCNLQGRLMNLLDVIVWQHYHLIMPCDLLALTQASLAKPALLSRVKLNINSNHKILGLYIQNPDNLPLLPFTIPNTAYQATQTEQHYCYALNQHLIVMVLNEELEQQVLTQFSSQHTRGSLAWHYLQLQHNRLSIYPNTRGLFLPHRLGLQHTAYISFNKGCYKGQEIIARTHYRAKLKHTLKAYTVNSSEPLFAGQKIFNANHTTEIGELIDYCPIGNDRYLIQISALSEHSEQVQFDGHLKPSVLSLYAE